MSSISSHSSAYRHVPPPVATEVAHFDLEARAPSSGPAPGSDGLAEPALDQGGEITIVICDQQPVFARGLAKLLGEQASDLRIAGVATTINEAEDLIRETLPDVGLIGLCAASSADLDFVREICSVSRATRVVLLLPEGEVRATSAALSGTRVSGYVIKEKEVFEIAEVVRLVARGHFVMPSEMDRLQSAIPPHLHALKDIERQILMGIAGGETNREIAARLHLSQRTVCRRLENIYYKLNVADRLEAAVYAATHGLVVKRDEVFERQDDIMER